MVHLTRANPFAHAQPGTSSKAAASTAASPSLTNSPPASPAPSTYAPSFLDNFRSAIATAPAAPAPAAAPAAFTVPAMPPATYTGVNGEYDPGAVDGRTAAASAMLAAIGNNDVKAYQQAAANFLAASPAGSGLPVWAATITVDPRGNMINTNSAGIATDGTVVAEGGKGYAGMMNPVPGAPNIADGTANALGVVLYSTRT